MYILEADANKFGFRLFTAKLSEKNAKGTKNLEFTNHTTVGHKNHDITFKKLPMYSFPKGEKINRKGK